MQAPLPCPESPINELRPELLRLARRLTRAEDTAQDIVQETLLRVWMRRQSHDIEEPLAYARAVVRNLYLESLRRRPFLPLEDGMEDGIGHGGDAALALNKLTAALARLPSSQAAVIRLVVAGETSPRAMAEQLGCPTGTVMSRLARARAQLRHEMGIGPDAPVCSLY